MCAKYQVPFVLDDDVELALEVGADGVHVGQSDMEAGDVRAKLGEDKIVGVSAQTVEQALLAQERGADYLGVGAVFPTSSKDDAVEVDHEMVKAICEAVDIPVIAIAASQKIMCRSCQAVDFVESQLSALFSQNRILRKQQKS